MKYFILLLISLFCLTSFSAHKDKDKTYPLESYYYDKEKDPEKWEMEDEERRVYEHFNRYMRVERGMDEALTGDPQYYIYAFHQALPGFLYDRISTNPNSVLKYPYCTKERLKEEKCPRPPYIAIYWAKKAFESGYCVDDSSDRMMDLMIYVFRKTDMEDNEEFFRLLYYVAYYFNYHSYLYEKRTEYKKLEKQAKSKLEKKAENDPYFKFDPKKEFCAQDEVCATRKKESEDRTKTIKEGVSKRGKQLNEKQKKIADRMISDLTKKWSKKYGKDKIYECRSELKNRRLEKLELSKRFLEEKYPDY